MSLVLTYAEIRRAVGRLLGFGADPAAFDPSAILAVDDAMRAGLRDFYWPSINGAPYDWSFLRKSATFSLLNATPAYSFPTDFARLSSAITIAGSSFRLRQVSSSVIRTMGAAASESGSPVYFSVSIDGAAIAAGNTRYVATLFPVPNASATLTYGYIFSPSVDFTTGGPLGGDNHASAIIECCLARAELSMNLESLQQTGGIHISRSAQLLSLAIESDRDLQAEVSPVSQTMQQTAS